MTSDSDAAPPAKGHTCGLLCPVGHVMSPPSFVEPDSSLRKTARTLAEQGPGSAAILGRQGPTSIVTERDVVTAVATNADPDRTDASDVGSECLVSVSVDAPVLEVLREMAALGIRHMPVLSDGEIVGVVAAEEVLRLVLPNLADEMVGRE